MTAAAARWLINLLPSLKIKSLLASFGSFVVPNWPAVGEDSPL
jgi:hypothetical protein